MGTAGTAQKMREARKQEDLDRQLNEALKDTFPASDPVSVGDVSVKPTGRADRPPAPINTEEVKRLARSIEKKHQGGESTGKR